MNATTKTRRREVSARGHGACHKQRWQGRNGQADLLDEHVYEDQREAVTGEQVGHFSASRWYGIQHAFSHGSVRVATLQDERPAPVQQAAAVGYCVGCLAHLSAYLAKRAAQI